MDLPKNNERKLDRHFYTVEQYHFERWEKVSYEFNRLRAIDIAEMHYAAKRRPVRVVECDRDTVWEYPA